MFQQPPRHGGTQNLTPGASQAKWGVGSFWNYPRSSQGRAGPQQKEGERPGGQGAQMLLGRWCRVVRTEEGARSGANDKGHCDLQSLLHQELSALGLVHLQGACKTRSQFLSHQSMGGSETWFLPPLYRWG